MLRNMVQQSLRPEVRAYHFAVLLQRSMAKGRV
jgi:hypothetical protein